MKTRPKCYKFPLPVPKEVYEFMISPKGVGSSHQLFNLCGTDKHFHDSTDRFEQFSYVAWYKRKRDVIAVLVWLIDWYHAAAKRTDGKCLFPNWNIMCGL